MRVLYYMQYLDRLCETFINANNEYVCIQPKNPEKGSLE